ncbi:unnamed protein product, partial [Linum tenue]
HRFLYSLTAQPHRRWPHLSVLLAAKYLEESCAVNQFSSMKLLPSTPPMTQDSNASALWLPQSHTQHLLLRQRS